MSMSYAQAKKHFKKETKLTKKEWVRLNQLMGLIETKADWLVLVSILSHQDFIWKVRTTEVSAVLGISRNKAYDLLCEAEKAGITSGWQTSVDYADSISHLEKTTKRYSREAVVWEICIKDKSGRYLRKPDGGDWDGTTDLEELIARMRKTLKQRGIV